MNPDQQHPQAQLLLWPDHWLVEGRLLPNRTHRHISASLLMGLDGAFDLEVDGQWRTTRAALVAPDVAQALDPGSTRLRIAHLDPDSTWWLRLKPLLAGQSSVDIDVVGVLEPQAGALDCNSMSRFLEAIIACVDVAPTSLDNRIDRVCKELRATMPEPLVVAHLAEAVGLSVSRLTHLFREQTGVPLRRFFLHLKLTRVLSYWQPGKNFSQLAVEAGFYDQPHLIRTARQMFDALPSAYITTGWFQVRHCGPAGP